MDIGGDAAIFLARWVGSMIYSLQCSMINSPWGVCSVSRNLSKGSLVPQSGRKLLRSKVE